jgi:predicted NBD/HSP70 family sugar kinase
MLKQDVYKNAVLKELYFLRKASCADLSERTGKSLPLVQKIVNEMINEGYLEETGLAPSTGGRRPAVYSLRPHSMYIVSVAMDQFFTKIEVLDTCNNHITSRELDLPLAKRENILDTLLENIQTVIAGTGLDRNKFIGVGIGMPGFVDFKQGRNYSFFECEDRSIVKYLNEQLGLPVYIDNDSSLIALAEFCFGTARKTKNAMVLNIGWGVGLGMILNGQLFRGHNGFAGEFSHIPLFNNNKLCQCGKSGCLETESSLQVIIEKVHEGLKDGRPTSLKSNFDTKHLQHKWNDIVHAAANGDQFVIEILSDIGYNIGRGIAVLIHLFNPETVILSGRGASAGKLWSAPIQQALNEHCIPRLASNTSIEFSSLGAEAFSIGCSALVIENFNPELSVRVVDQFENALTQDHSLRSG